MEVICELSGQQPMVKTFFASPLTIPTIKRQKFNNKNSTENLKKSKEYFNFSGVLQFFGLKFFMRFFFFDDRI